MAIALNQLKKIPDNYAHLILSDIPYGIGYEDWDVLHDNKNSAYLGSSPSQRKAGAVFKKRGKPINGCLVLASVLHLLLDSLNVQFMNGNVKWEK